MEGGGPADAGHYIRILPGRPVSGAETPALYRARGVDQTTRGTANSRFANVSEEMRNYLFELGVDALFTDNPDKFPR